MIESLSEIKSTNMESLAQVTSAMTQATKVKGEVSPQAQVMRTVDLDTSVHDADCHGNDNDGVDNDEEVIKWIVEVMMVLMTMVKKWSNKWWRLWR